MIDSSDEMSMPRKPSSSGLADRLIIDPLASLLGYQLRRASLAMLSDLSSTLEDLALRPTTASVLLLIESNPGITQSQIGQVLAVERANMAPLTAKLTKRGMVARSRADGRSQGLRLTKEGKRTVLEVRRRITSHEEKFWRDTSSSKQELFLSFLRTLWTE